MIVCIAEKPSVARSIARVLGANSSHDGYIEGNGYQVTWTFGHLCELKYPEDYSPLWKRWSLSALPMIPPRFGIRLKSDKGIQKQFGVIQKLMSKADSIVNCGDAGQEGELIQRWVMQMARAKCPVRRLWVSSLTDESIKEGFSQLRDQSDYQLLYEAGLCRAIGDWLLGMNATRLYTLKYGERQFGQPPLSIGRVQTPTLALIVRRQQEIENFKPEPYWVVNTVYRDTTFTTTKGKYKDAAEAQQIMAEIEDKPFTVADVTKKNGTESPPRLFDLTSLQVECNKKFSFTAEQTLNVIQSLYEKKVTTYPRVDTTYLSDDIYSKCGGILNNLSEYSQLLSPLRGRPLRKSKKVFDTSKVTDHHAIIPTGVTKVPLTADEQKVYNLVARRFIAVFYPDCRFSTTTVMGKIGSVDFKANGKQIIEQGWRYVFADDKSSVTEDKQDNKDEEHLLPDFKKGESGSHKPSIAQKFTQPPKLYTEATLLRAMETAGKDAADEQLREALKENGLGRPSTRAAIIETLFRRRYIRRERKSLVATPTGIDLISLIHEDLLKSAELTGLWERKLRQIEKHEYKANDFIADLKKMVADLVQSVLNDNTNRRVSITADAKSKKNVRKGLAAKTQRASGNKGNKQ